jgi:predicted restriction endonuclease
MMNQTLIDEFNREVIRLCDVTKKETGYNNQKGFRGKVLRVGAYDATKDILDSTSDNWNGFTELVLSQRLDLSLEVLVLQQRWQSLFTKDQLINAQRRLRQVKYKDIPEIIEVAPNIIEEQVQETKRREYTINSVIRDSSLAKEVKQLYNFKCQVCGTVLVAQGRKYAEAAHIRPVGEPHNGQDTIDNIMCLCPNHHKLFDMGGFFVDDNLKISTSDTNLHVDARHKVNRESFRYHREWFENNV